MCILLVDDDPLILMTEADSLEEAGHTVLTAMNGPMAIQLMERRPGFFTCLVTDYHMPLGMTGGDLIEWVRRHNPGLPLILATSRDMTTEQWRAEYCVSLLTKPFTPRELLAAVRGQMHSQRH